MQKITNPNDALKGDAEMTVRQYHSIDQSDPRHIDFIEKVTEKLRSECRTAIECRRRLLCSPCTAPSASEGHVCDDVLVEIIVDGHLVAMQYQRRTDSNCTETTEIIL